MSLKLVRIGVEDTENLWIMQRCAFKGLLEKYKDFETNPGNESKETVKTKLMQ